MAKTTAAPTLTRGRPNANPEGAGLIITLLQRYVDGVAGRTRRELSLAGEIDAREGGRAAAEEAVRRWRALPADVRVATAGRAAATLEPAARLDDDTLARQARAAFAPRLVRRPEGIGVRAATIGRTPLDAPDFALPDGSGRVVADQGAPEPLGPGADADPGRVLGDPPALVAAGGPLYQVEFAGIYCDEETSWDQGSNSDEIYCSFTMFDDHNRSWTKRSAVYGDVDSNEAKGEKPKPCVLWGPGPLPVERTFVSTLVMEHDFGNPDEIKKLWHDAATIGACVAKYYGVDVDAAVVDSAASLLDKIFNFGDDVMGWDTAVLWPEYLAWAADQPKVHWKGLVYNFFLFHTNNDAEYYSFYRIHRF